MVGQFALGLAVCAPVFLLARLSLRPVQATDARAEFHFGHYLALRIVTVPGALAFVGVIVLTVDYRPEVSWVIGAVAIAKAAESLGDPFYGVFQQRERMDHLSKSLITKGLLGLAAFTAVFGLTGNLAWSVVAVAMAWVTVLLLYDYRVAPSFSITSPIWEPRALIGLARLALPLGMAAMLLSLNSNLPRYFVERFLGEYELGVYAALAYPVVALGMVFNAMGQAASPRMARLYSRRDSKGYTVLLIKLAAFGVAIGAVSLATAAFFGSEMLAFLYQPEYGHHVDIFLWFLAAFILSSVSSSLGYGLTATRSFRLQPALFTASALVGCLFCYLLIPRYGLYGAVWAYGAALVVQVVGALICHLIVFRRTSAFA